MKDVTFAVLSNKNIAPLTKTYRLEGEELKKGTEAHLYEGRVGVESVADVTDFATVLSSLEHYKALTYGRTERGGPVYSAARYEKLGCPEGAVTRSNAHFHWPDGPGVLMLDYDPQTGQKALTKDEFLSRVFEAAPALAACGYVWTPSSSSHIFNADTGEDLTGLKGQRLYFLVGDATDIPRAGDALFQRLWLAGHGFYQVTKSGAMLERSIIDATVWQPCRLDFASGASCTPPLVQRRGSPEVWEGPRVNTREAIPDLEEGERVELGASKAREYQRTVGEAEQVRERFTRTRAEKMVPIELLMDPGAYDAALADALNTVKAAVSGKHVLTKDFEIVLKTGEVVTVGAMLADPSRYRGAITLDPLEPDYNGGADVGKVFIDEAGAYINSMAHGRIKYILRDKLPEEELAEALSDFDEGVEVIGPKESEKGSGDGDRVAKLAESFAKITEVLADCDSLAELMGEAAPELGKLVGNDLVLQDALIRNIRVKSAEWGSPQISDRQARNAAGLVKEKKAKADLGLSQQGLHDRVAAKYGDRLAYAVDTKRWYLWQGPHWVRESDEAIRAIVRSAKDDLEAEARDAGDEEALYFCQQYKDATEVGVTNFLKPTFRTTVDTFDADVNLFGVANGVYDFTKRSLTPASPEHKITKATAVPYDPEATCPLFEQTMSDVFFGDQEMVAFFQRLVGYSLLGTPSEVPVFVVLHGDGSNGKTTVMSTLQNVLGGHAVSVEVGTVTSAAGGAGGGGAREDILRLHGTRFAYVSEPAEDSQLSENLIKSATGGEKLAARALYSRDTVQITPTFTLFVATNHKPVISGGDHGIWRRLLCLPFTRNFDTDDTVSKDQRRRDKLKAEYPGILAWCIRGSLAYLDARTSGGDGLLVPGAVRAAVEEYQEEMGPVNAWIEECFDLVPEGTVSNKTLWGSWETWAKDVGVLKSAGVVSMNKLSKLILASCKGVGKAEPFRENGRTVRGLCGLKTKSESEDDFTIIPE